MHLRAEKPSHAEGFSVTLEFMRKSQLIVTLIIDDLPEDIADRTQDAMHDGCPVEITINGRHFIPTITASIQDSREKS